MEKNRFRGWFYIESIFKPSAEGQRLYRYGYIDVGDDCWGQFMLVTSLRY